MSKLIGLVGIQAIDIITGDLSYERVETNFIFNENYVTLWTDNNVLVRPVIVARGEDIYPCYDRQKPYYGANLPFLTGYAPTGTSLSTFFQKTDTSPPYIDFYSLFLPPAATSNIPCIALSTITLDNTEIPPNYGGTSIGSGFYLKTALNLDPYCYQSPTEYLNVYYRLVLLEDEGDFTPDFVKNQFVQDINRGALKALFPNVEHKTYPFRIEQDMESSGFVNFLSGWNTSAQNKETTYPITEHGKLRFAQKTNAYPDAAPYQYGQVVHSFINTIVRGAGSAYLLNETETDTRRGIRLLINPTKIIDDITIDGFRGVGNVFSSSGSSSSMIFDPANFPVGSGRMSITGVYSDAANIAVPTTYQCEIQENASSYANSSYRVNEYRFLNEPDVVNPVPLILFPYASETTSNGGDPEVIYADAKRMMYKDADRIHLSKNMVTYIEDQAFITWDDTGITIYNVYKGVIEYYDVTTTPSLQVTSIVDVKVDIYGNIWIACAQTGLWKLTIGSSSTTLTRIGMLPGSQQKCYAIDVDKHGNVYAIFWGTGLFYSTDSGASWVNAIIDYPPFSGYEGAGFVSKWSYVGRLICNPERDAATGVAQLLILMKPTGTDYATTAGCWWDQQSAETTGLTNTSMKSRFQWALSNRSGMNVAVSDDTNTWFFLNAGNSLAWCEFQQNAAMTVQTFTEITNSVNAMIHEWSWSSSEGILKEYLHLGVFPNTATSGSIAGSRVIFFDVLEREQVASVTMREGKFTTPSLLVDTANSIRLGKNIIVSRRQVTNTSSSGDVAELGYVIHHHLPFNKDIKQFNSISWGWNGSQWVKNHLGNKPLHTNFQPLFRGIENKFTDGNPATQSWALGDTATFTCGDGFFKDNSSTMVLRDTVYYKPIEEVGDFYPAIVSLTDRTSDIGLLNGLPIETAWDINDLPDTIYNGAPIVSNGDPFWASVKLFAHWNENINVQIGPMYDGVVGNPEILDNFQMFGEDSLYLDGSSGFILNASQLLSPVNGKFTFDISIVPETIGTKMHIIDFRVNSGGMMAFGIDESGRLFVESNGVTYGNIGVQLFPGEQYDISVVRDSLDAWRVYVNGVIDFGFSRSGAFNTTVTPRLFMRFDTVLGDMQAFRGWASNLRYTVGVCRYTGNNYTRPSTLFVDFGNSSSGAGLLLSGNFNNGAVVSKRLLVGDWSVRFSNLTAQNRGYYRQRPVLAFGVSVLKYILSPTDISYRICGNNAQTFLQNHTQGLVVPPEATDFKIVKQSDFVSAFYSINGGADWVAAIAPTLDYNPVHHVCFWQVQAAEVAITTPSVTIEQNGAAYFSAIGSPSTPSGYYAPQFLSADGYFTTDVSIALDSVDVSKIRTNYNDPAPPLAGEVLVLESGFIRFHPSDIDKAITGGVVTLKD